jgi:hypothetical protein
MMDKDFWLKAVAILREREIFVERVWAEALRHRDTQGICELMGCQHNNNSRTLSNILTGGFYSQLLAWAPQMKKTHRQKEYNPMINSRAHKVGGQEGSNKILNKTFRQTYDNFL